MNKNLKKLKSYLNENGLRFNLNEQRIWKYIEEIFGENSSDPYKHLNQPKPRGKTFSKEEKAYLANS